MSLGPDTGPAVAGNSYTAAIESGHNATDAQQHAEHRTAYEVRSNFGSSIGELPVSTFVEKSAGVGGGSTEISGLQAVSLGEAVDLAGRAAHAQALSIASQMGLSYDEAQGIAIEASQQAQYAAVGKAGQMDIKVENGEQQESPEQSIQRLTEELELERQQIEETRQTEGSTLDSSPLTEAERQRLVGAIAALSVETELFEQKAVSESLFSPDADRGNLHFLASQFEEPEDIFALGVAIAVTAFEESQTEQARQELERQQRAAEIRETKAELAASYPTMADELAAVPDSCLSAFAAIREIAIKGQQEELKLEQSKARAGNPAEMESIIA